MPIVDFACSLSVVDGQTWCEHAISRCFIGSTYTYIYVDACGEYEIFVDDLAFLGKEHTAGRWHARLLPIVEGSALKIHQYAE